MSWAEAFGLYGVDVSSPGVADYARGAVIQQRVAEGWSANAILGELSNNGLGIRRSQGLALVRNEYARQQASSTINQVGVDYTTGELLPSTPPENWTGEYTHRVAVTYRVPDDQGNYELHTRYLSVVAGTPLSPLAATNAALDIMEEEPEPGGTPRLPKVSGVLATQMAGVWYRTGRTGHTT